MELARRAGLSGAQISDVIGDRTDPGMKFYQGVSHALKIPLVTVFEQAGILNSYADDPYLTELAHLLPQLPVDMRQDIVAYARFRLNQDSPVTLRRPQPASDLEQTILAHLQGMDVEFQETVLKTIRLWRMYEELKRGKNT